MVLTDPVQLAHALNPTNDSERLLFRQLFETLVRLDCRGNVRPGLAQSWRADSSGRVWTFTLREGARFPEGTPVTAFQISSTLAGQDAKALGIDSALDLDDRQLRVRLRDIGDTVPRLFADPALAVISGLASAGGSVSRIAIPPREGRPLIDFQLAQNGDPRDAIDRGVDLAVTRDPAVVEYVASRPEFATYPLPWSRTYLLLQPAGARLIDGVFGLDSLRRSLARDAVRTEARAAELPFWSDSLAACAAAPALERQVGATSRVVYPSDDEVARGLAERIVALSGDAQLRAAPLARAEFAVALHQGAQRGFVVPVPRRTLDPCREAAEWPAGAIQPLIDTRARAIVRRGSPPLTVDWDGTVRIEESSKGSR